MKQALSRYLFLLPVVLIGGYVLADVAMDHQVHGGGYFSWPHFVTGGAVVTAVIWVTSLVADARRRAEDELHRARAASDAKYRLLFQNMAEGFAHYELLLDDDGQPADWRILEVNEAYARHTGISRAEIAGRRASELFPAAIPVYLPRFARVVDSQIAESFETYAAAVGRYHRVWTFPAGDKRFASTIEDISERKRAEAELSASEEKFAKIFHHSPDAIGLFQEETGTVLDINEAFTRVLGFQRSAVTGLNWKDLNLVSGTTEATVADLYGENGQVMDLEVDLRTSWGRTASMLVSLMPVTVADTRCVLLIAHDITARKQSEVALRRAEVELERGAKARAILEERQRLARELHDSVSQALYGVALGINTALALYDRDRQKTLESLEYALSLTRAGLQEMRALIFELRPEALQAEGLVASIKKQAEASQARHEIEVGTDLCEEPNLSLAGKEALYRIVQEALQNAIKHGQSGRLDVRMRIEQDEVTVEICDNGVGFDPEASYPGHLGLKSMRERAANLGGRLEIISAPGCGTQVVASIPVTPVAPTTGEDAISSPAVCENAGN